MSSTSAPSISPPSLEPVISPPEPSVPPKPEDTGKPGTVPKRSSSCVGIVGTVLFFAGMFILGIWLSSFVRQYLPNGSATPTPSPTEQATPTLSLSLNGEETASGSSLFSDWKTYTVISGATKKQVPGITFGLPPDVLSPVCDGAACSSQGTYLTGGTRFTVAPRGAGQVLKDYRGSTISDVGGTPFTTKSTSVGGLRATEFAGTFVGRTVSGYGFSRMRGVMIEVTDTLSLEVNHFTPNGITADFASDDVLFDKILQTFTFSASLSGAKGALVPSPSAPVATASGY